MQAEGNFRRRIALRAEERVSSNRCDAAPEGRARSHLSVQFRAVPFSRRAVQSADRPGLPRRGPSHGCLGFQSGSGAVRTPDVNSRCGGGLSFVSARLCRFLIQERRRRAAGDQINTDRVSYSSRFCLSGLENDCVLKEKVK